MSTPTPEGVPGTLADDIRFGTGGSKGGLDPRGTGYETLAASILSYSIHAACGRLRIAQPLIALAASKTKPRLYSTPLHQAAPGASPEVDLLSEASVAYCGLTGSALEAAIARDRDLLKLALQKRAIALSGKLLEARQRVVADIRARYASEADITDLAQALPIMIAARQELPLPLTVEKAIELNYRLVEDLQASMLPIVLFPDAKPQTEREVLAFNVMVYRGRERGSWVDDYNATMSATETTRHDRGAWAPDWHFASVAFAERANAVGLIYGTRSEAEYREAIYLRHPIASLLPLYESYFYELADSVRMLDVAERNARIRKMIHRLCRDLEDANLAFAREIANPRRTSALDWKKYRPLLEVAALDLYWPGNPIDDPLYRTVLSIVNELEPFDWVSMADRVLMAIGIGILVGVFLQVEFAAAIPLLVDVGGAVLAAWRYWEAIEASERGSAELQFTQIDQHLLKPIEQAPSVDGAALALFMSLLFVVAGVRSMQTSSWRPPTKALPEHEASGGLSLVAPNELPGAVSEDMTGRLSAAERVGLAGEREGGSVLPPDAAPVATPGSAAPSALDEMRASANAKKAAKEASLREARGTDPATRLGDLPKVKEAEVTLEQQEVQELLESNAKLLVEQTDGASLPAMLVPHSPPPKVTAAAVESLESTARADRLGGVAGYPLVSIVSGVVESSAPGAADHVTESTAPVPDPAPTTVADPDSIDQASALDRDGSAVPTEQAKSVDAGSRTRKLVVSRHVVTSGQTSYSFKKSASYYPGVPAGHRITVQYSIQALGPAGSSQPSMNVIMYRFRASEFTSIGRADWMDLIRARYAGANRVLNEYVRDRAPAYVLTKSQLEEASRRSEGFASDNYDLDQLSELKLNVDEMLSLAFSGEAYDANQMVVPFVINQIVSKADGAVVRWARSQGDPNEFRILYFVVEFQ